MRLDVPSGDFRSPKAQPSPRLLAYGDSHDNSCPASWPATRRDAVDAATSGVTYERRCRPDPAIAFGREGRGLRAAGHHRRRAGPRRSNGEHGRLGERGAPGARPVVDRHTIRPRRTRCRAHAGLGWEREQWGTARPRWADALERVGEQHVLRETDLVACGSTAVLGEVIRLGVPEARTIITPTGVDLGLFENVGDPGALRRRLGLDDQFVVGWVGSFRRFHSIEQAIEAMAGIERATLLLV